MNKAILFYGHTKPFGEFSNFANYPIRIDNKIWPTSEHYFQAMKFTNNPEYQEEIRLSKNPATAKSMGSSRTYKLRADWENVKDGIMMTALRAKFTQYDELKKFLINTGKLELVEHTKNDKYWGDGGDGSGQNKLGKLLVQLRTELVNSEKQKDKQVKN